MRSHPGAFQLTILHIIDVDTGGGFSSVVPSKSPSPVHMNLVTDFIKFMGYGAVTIQTDPGADISALITSAAASLRSAGIVVGTRVGVSGRQDFEL